MISLFQESKFVQCAVNQACNFINNIHASGKIAVDKYLDPKGYVSKGIMAIKGDYRELVKLVRNGSVDVAFASNILEHLDDGELNQYLKVIWGKLRPGGRIIILQPNYKYCTGSYFDDYTHTKVWTHISMVDYLLGHGFEPLRVIKAFLPFSMKGRSSALIFPLLIRLYLWLPYKPFAAQMLIIARKSQK